MSSDEFANSNLFQTFWVVECFLGVLSIVDELVIFFANNALVFY